MQKVFKFPKALLFLLLLFLIFTIGCDDSKNFGLLCSFEEMQERFATSDCLGDEMVTGCTNISCGGEFINVVNFDEQCVAVDCETLECDRIEIRDTNPSIVVPGFLTELVISQENGLPSGVAAANDMEFPFTCSFIANQ